MERENAWNPSGVVGKGLGKLSGSVRASRRGKKDSGDSRADDSLNTSINEAM